MNISQPSKDAVSDAIKIAFSRVELRNGIGLWQAQSIDDYESEEAQLLARERDRKTDWSLIPSNDLHQCYSSLCFFDSEGMRFHLPAFIIVELEEAYGDVVFSLIQLDDYKRSMFTALNPVQRNAVKLFLQFCLSQEVYCNDHKDIKSALDEYWQYNEFQPSLPSENERNK